VRAEVLRLAARRAGRSGLWGELVHPHTSRPAKAADVIGDLLEHVRPALADAGDEQPVADGVAAMLDRGAGADLQRRVHSDTARAAVLSTG
jgi:carboxylate-amine ligase